MSRDARTEPSQLLCIECGVGSDEDARGWRAYLGGVEDEPIEVVVYCPECSKEEFGGDA